MVAEDTIFALSSGSPPAALAVVRISGPEARTSLFKLSGKLPPERRATLATLRDPEGSQVIDNAIVILFPGPHSATGEDIAELHLHGGRAVVAEALRILSRLNGLRHAEPGEFTRRAFENGRIDLTEAEGLADLLAAETESQRRAAMSLSAGLLTQRINGWQSRLLALSAQVEALLDFSDEGEVGEQMPVGWDVSLAALVDELRSALDRPPAERLKDGIRVVIGGPPNAGKSTLLNALVQREAAIVSPIAGTTRDVIEAPVAINGIPFLFADTAGLRMTDADVEAIGIERARAQLEAADIILWLGAPNECPARTDAIRIRSKADIADTTAPADAVHVVLSPVTGEGMDTLLRLLTDRATGLLPREGEVALNARHRAALESAKTSLAQAGETDDPLIIAEHLRQALRSLDAVTGRAGVEDMLDSLFGRFCVGK